MGAVGNRGRDGSIKVDYSEHNEKPGLSLMS